MNMPGLPVQAMTGRGKPMDQRGNRSRGRWGRGRKEVKEREADREIDDRIEDSGQS